MFSNIIYVMYVIEDRVSNFDITGWANVNKTKQPEELCSRKAVIASSLYARKMKDCKNIRKW